MTDHLKPEYALKLHRGCVCHMRRCMAKLSLAKIAARTIPKFDTYLHLFETKDPESLAEIAKIVVEHIIFMIKDL